MKKHPKLARLGLSESLYFPFYLKYGRRPGGEAGVKALVIFEPNHISYSQIYPFIYFGKKFKQRYDASFQFVRSTDFVTSDMSRYHEVTHVFFQTWLTDPLCKLHHIIDKIKKLPNIKKIVFLDSFANSDIRISGNLKNVDLYFKKTIFNCSEDYHRPTFGDTNLADFYGKLYGLKQPVVDWEVPMSAVAKLRLSPNFLTDPLLMKLLGAADGKIFELPRDIDLHSRLGGTNARGWYGEMRRDAERRIRGLRGVSVRTGIGLGQAAFRSELQRSKICFSPFGYGEVCWRDVEAIAAGAVLLKPDMSHVRTEPDLYRNGETYIGVKWDFSDLEEKIFKLLADPTLIQQIAQNARRVARDYLLNYGPVNAYSDAFADEAS